MLSSPRRFYRDIKGWPWAADNDAFSAWDEGRYLTMIDAISGLGGCLFVTAPDVVGDGNETLKRFREWQPYLRDTQLPIALVAQDGMVCKELPWPYFDALFIGGSTAFKMGEAARTLAEEAKRRHYWLHMGRVNGHQRIRYAKAIGCDSIDGTSLSWFKDAYLRSFLEHAAGPTQGMLA